MHEIQITTLDNGLRVVTDAMPSVESVSTGVWVHAGTRYEQPEVNGVAHLLEHMMFKGTPRRNAREIAEAIEAVGGHINAFTAREVTAYYAKVLKADTGLALEVIGDIVQHSLFDDTELGRERNVVLQEIGQAHDTPDDIVFDNFQEIAFPDQPLGRPVLGRPDIIRTMSRDKVDGFHKAHYNAGSMVVAAAGNVEHERVVEMAAAQFGGLASEPARPIDSAAYAGGEHRESRDLEQVHFVLGFRGAPVGTPDFYTLSVLSNLFGGSMSSRLFQEIRERRGLVYSIDTFTPSFSDDGLFGIYAGTGPELLDEFVPALCGEIVSLADTVSEEELSRARAQLKSSLLMAMESTSARCERIAQQILLYGRVVPTDELVERVEAVDTAAVSRAARRVFAETPSLAVIGPVDGLESYDAIRRRLAA